MVEAPPPTDGTGDEPPAGPLMAIGAVATKLSVPPTTLRTWGRRYGLTPSGRTSGGHRRFTEEDVQRLHVMVHLVGLGVSPGSAARSARDTLGPELLGVEDDAPGPTSLDRLVRTGPDAVVEALVAAAQDLDQNTVDTLAGLSIVRSGVAPAWDEVLAPFLAVLRLDADADADADAGSVVERLAIERLVGVLASPHHVARTGPSVLLAGLGEGEHALPLLVLEAALDTDHVPTHNLGRRTPTATVVQAVARVEPAAIFLWAERPPPDDDAIWSLVDGDAPVPLVLLGTPGPRRGGVLVPGALPSTATHALASLRHVL